MTTLKPFNKLSHYKLRTPYQGYPWWSGLWDVILTIVGAIIFIGGKELISWIL